MSTNNQRLASFRIDSDIWSDFIEYARSNHRTATSLLTEYIENCIDKTPTLKTNHIDNYEVTNEEFVKLRDSVKSMSERGHYQNRLIRALQNKSEGHDLAIKRLDSRSESNQARLSGVESTNDKRYQKSLSDINELTQKLANLQSEITAINQAFNSSKNSDFTNHDLRTILEKAGVKYRKKAPKQELMKVAEDNGLL